MADVQTTSADEEARSTPTVTMKGGFVDRLSTIHSSLMSLVVALGGAEDGTQVLLPFVDLTVISSLDVDDEDEEESSSHIVPLENAAFLLADMTGEFVTALGDLERLSGATRLDPTRLKLVEEYLSMTRGRLDSADESLRRLLQT